MIQLNDIDTLQVDYSLLLDNLIHLLLFFYYPLSLFLALLEIHFYLVDTFFFRSRTDSDGNYL